MPEQPPAKPVLTLRVGITGTRLIDPAHHARIEAQVDDALRRIHASVSALCHQTSIRSAYALGAGDWPTCMLLFLSPLAEGADRLSARLALNAGYQLFVPMPFARKEYERDFLEIAGMPHDQSASVREFRELLSMAGRRRLELDGHHRNTTPQDQRDKARSYEAVGQFVVNNCDILIAVWDGLPPRGWGGTADIVRQAATAGTPVIWINTEDATAPRWIASPQDLQLPRRADPWDDLKSYLDATLSPPTALPPHEHLIFQRSLNHFRRHGNSPLDAYYRAPPHPLARGLKLYDTLVDAAAWRPFRRGPPQYRDNDDRGTRVPPTPPATARYWETARRHAGLWATASADRFRSGYTWMLTLLTISLIAASAGLAINERTPHHHALETTATTVECATLLLVIVLLCRMHWKDWHQRWIDCRLLAELCRSQQVLSTIGWPLPGRAVANMAQEPAHVSDHHGSSGPAWVAWLFAALIRAAPLPTGRYNSRTLQRPIELLRRLAIGQSCYHIRQGAKRRRAAQGLGHFGEAAFAVVFIVILAKLALIVTHVGSPTHIVMLGLLAATIPPIGAAVIGIRFYAELSLLAEQSRRMRHAMFLAARRLRALRRSHPLPALASQQVGAIGQEMTIAMLQDVDGWARMFRDKVLEPG